MGTADTILGDFDLQDPKNKDLLEGKIVEAMLERELNPVRLKLLVDEVERVKTFVNQASEDTKVRLWPPTALAEDIVDSSKVLEGIRSVEDLELLIFLDATNPDATQRIGLLEIFRDIRGAEPPKPGEDAFTPT